MYVLRERLYRHSGHLRNAAKAGSRVHTNITLVITDLRDIVVHQLKGVSGLRNQHVHDRRFSDSEASSLRTLEFLVFNAGMEPLLGFYKTQLAATSKKWKKTLHSNNGAVKRHLDAYCDVIYTAVFTTAGELRGVH